MEKLRCNDPLSREWCQRTDDFETFTSEEQADIEDSVNRLYERYKDSLSDSDNNDEYLRLNKCKLAEYLLKGLRHLGPGYQSLDASHPWLCYWIIHALELIEEPIPADMGDDVIEHLKRCQCDAGGFSGGTCQEPHLAPTYAAVNTLCIIGKESGYKIIDRKNIYKWLLSLRTKSGAFTMHHGGEVDVRGVYCALSVAKILNLITDELVEGTAEWIASCQTYEGGFSGAPGLEAHGGYSFCAFAALQLLEKEHLCDMKRLLRWSTFQQMSFEGGFHGRTNKLVDSCYSFWQGGVFPLLHRALSKRNDNALSCSHWMFHQSALQEYVLVCCQTSSGGLRDKPGKHSDYYHTCYALSGLSIAQHFDFGKFHKQFIIGEPTNVLNTTDPVHNISPEALETAVRYFESLPSPEYFNGEL